MARRYIVETVIAAAPTVVWDLLTDAEGYADWNAAVVSVDGQISVGETIDLVSVVEPKRTFSLTVTEMVPPHRMVWTDGMPLGLFTGTRTYTLSERADGVQFSMAEEFGGPLAPIVTRVIPDLTESFELFADSLRTAAETIQSSA